MIEKLNLRLKPKDWQNEDFRYKQIKLDGHRLTFIKGDDSKLQGYGRTVKPDFEISTKYPNVTHSDWWKVFEQMPRNSMVDGELWLLGGTSSDVVHHLVEETDQLLFSPFAIPWWNSYDKRTASLNAIDALLTCELGQKLTPWYEYNPILDTRKQMLDDARMLSIEGWVLKQANYVDWYKLKPVRTLDCIITGFQDGRGKFLGGVGALIVSVYIDGKLTPIAKVSGMDDETRWNIDEDADLGRVVEVKYDCIGAKGKLRFPRFVRWRDDKPAEECILE